MVHGLCPLAMPSMAGPLYVPLASFLVWLLLCPRVICNFYSPSLDPTLVCGSPALQFPV